MSTNPQDYESKLNKIAEDFNPEIQLTTISELAKETKQDHLDTLRELCYRIGTIVVGSQDKNKTLRQIASYDQVLSGLLNDGTAIIGPCDITNNNGTPFVSAISFWQKKSTNNKSDT